jgi:hypothetical protein
MRPKWSHMQSVVLGLYFEKVVITMAIIFLSLLVT